MREIRARVFKASWPGLSRPPTWFGASSPRKQPAEAKNPAFVGLCIGPCQYQTHLCGSAAWMAGTSRDKPGHDDKSSKAQSAKTGSTANAISALSMSFR